jgi:hypothetical protein
VQLLVLIVTSYCSIAAEVMTGNSVSRHTQAGTPVAHCELRERWAQRNHPHLVAIHMCMYVCHSLSLHIYLSQTSDENIKT